MRVRISPTSHLKAASPTLTVDSGEFAKNWHPETGHGQAKFFEQMAQLFITAVIVTHVRTHGEITLPELADHCVSVGSLSDEWLSLEYEMSQSSDREIAELAKELDRQRDNISDTGGWDGIKNELKRSFACMRDEQLRASVSNPNWDFSELVKPGAPPALVNLMEDHRYSEVSQPVIRALYNSTAHYKMGALDARPQAWLLDEVGNIKGGWPMVEQLASYAAGYNIRALIIVQSLNMLDRLIKDGSKVIPQSCGTQLFMGIRYLPDAEVVSRLLGQETRPFDDFTIQQNARYAQQQAVMSVAAGMMDEMQAAAQIRHNKAMASYRSVIKRPVRTPDEVINTPKGGVFVFMPGEMERGALNYAPPYWLRPDLAGRFLRDPYHSPKGAVELKTRFRGKQRRIIINDPVPDKYAHLPQYADGRWDYVDGYIPS